VIAVGPLGGRAHLVTELADAFESEWPEWCRTVSREALEDIFTSGSRLPAVLVATEAGHAVGTIALRPWFGDDAMEETPWVRQFLVLPAHRGRGIDRLLAAAIEERARELGFTHLYAATNRIERYLRRGGWEVFRRIEHGGAPMAWLAKSLVKTPAS
jgi:GNAT superfamily N-acetyltransferase